MSANPKPARPRERGLMLTEEALNLLDQALMKRWRGEEGQAAGEGSKRTLQNTGKLLGLDPTTVRRLYNRQPLDETTLKTAFDKLNITPPFLKARHCVSSHPPYMPASCFGRDADVEKIKTLLETNSLVTLTGAGGIGKTRLAVKVAEEIKSRYTAGIWFVKLAGLSDPALVPQRTASALGIQDKKDCSPLEALSDFLGGKPSLLILDNCEHLLEACATLADHLLSSSSDLRILATSQERLNIRFEHLYPVSSLAVPTMEQLSDGNENIADLLRGYAALQLFEEQAGMRGTGFTVTKQNVRRVASICRCLDGIPLAIELAAGCASTMSLDDLEHRLGDRFRLLTNGSRILARHQTLRAMMDWSYNLLTPKEKTLLGRLSVFAGGWTLEAGEKVCAGEGIEEWEALHLLSSLVNRSLVACEKNGADETRYRLLETIRQYGQERLAESGESETARERHQNYFLTLAEAHRNVNHDESRTLLDLEWQNIVNAAQIAADNLDWERTSRLTNALGPFLMTRGRWLLREQMNQRILDVLQASSDPDTMEKRAWVEAVTWNALGVVARVKTQWGKAEECFIASIAAWERCGSGGDKWKTLNSLGILYRSQHRLNEAEAKFCTAVTDTNCTRDVVANGCAQVNLGVVLQMQGRYAEAEQRFDAGLQMLSSTRSRLEIAQTMNNRGILNRARWRLSEAENAFDRSLEVRGPNGGESGIAQAKSNRATVLQMLGRLEESEKFTIAALETRRQMGNQEGTAASLTNLAILREMQGRRDDAERLLDEALAICHDLEDKVGEAKIIHNRGVFGYERGHPQAADDLNTSLELCQRYDDGEGSGRALLNLANIARRAGNFAEAEQLESKAFAAYSMLKEQQANFAAEWMRDPAIGERFHAIPYMANRAAGNDLFKFVADTLARFRWWDSHAALDAE